MSTCKKCGITDHSFELREICERCELKELLFNKTIDRRRRLFEEYVLRMIPGRDGDEENLEYWQWDIISKEVDLIISQADAFATKED